MNFSRMGSPFQHLCRRCFSRVSTSNSLSSLSRVSHKACHQTPFSTLTDADPKQRPSVLKGSRLSSRSLILVRGRDAADLLQGLMTNDLDLLNDDGGPGVMYSMFLNKQGRVLYDVMCYRWVKGQENIPSFLLECDSAISPELQKHLKFYRIRKKVDITSVDADLQTWCVFSSEDTPPPQHAPDTRLCQTHRYPDPRVKGLGQRVIVPHGSEVSGVEEACEEDYCAHRYQWGVAEGVNELPPGDCLPLEANLALMNGVDFAKGCYLGQELTARTHHTGVIRKRIMPIQLLGRSVASMPPGTTIKTKEGKNVGKLRCHLHQNGLALLRTALIGNQLWLQVEGGADQELEARRPAWWPQEPTNK